MPRPRVRLRDLTYWLLLRRIWSGWRDSVLIVRPSRVVHWHRQGWRRFWRWRSLGKPGRPPITAEVRERIRRLSTSKDLEDLVARAENLWPAHPATIPAYEQWLAEARALIEGKPRRGSIPRGRFRQDAP